MFSWTPIQFKQIFFWYLKCIPQKVHQKRTRVWKLVRKQNRHAALNRSWTVYKRWVTESYGRPSPPKIQGCQIGQQIQRWCKDQQWKNRRNLPNWLCFTAKRSEDYSIQRLRHVMVSCQSSHSMTSCPQQIAVPFAVCIFGGFGEMPWRPLPPKIQGCRIDQQIQRWLTDQLQNSIANKGAFFNYESYS